MEPYKNLGGTSNVIAYEIGAGEICVQFGDGSIYLYTDESAGSGCIEEMHRLAKAGRGLNSYINRVVKKNYSSKTR